MSKVIRSNDELNALANGKELFPNGDFSNGSIHPWVKDGGSVSTSTIEYDSGRLKVSADSSYNGAYYRLTGLVVGTTYEITCDIELGTATTANLRIQQGLYGEIVNPGGKFVGVATQTTVTFIARTGSSIGTVWFDNISVKEIPQVQGENLPDYVASRANFGFKNLLINGRFDVWQRGTSFTTNGYTADRWIVGLSNATVTNGINSIIRTTTGASGWCNLQSAIERANVIPLRGKTVTLSAYISATDFTGPIRLRLSYSTVNESSVSQTTVIDTNLVTPTAVLTRYTLTVVVPSDAKGLAAVIDYQDVQSTIGSQCITSNVQLEVGSVATPFEQRPYGLELSLCQRYYEKSGFFGTTITPTNMSVLLYHGYAKSAYQWEMVRKDFAIKKRINPTINVSDTDGSVGFINHFTSAGGNATAGHAPYTRYQTTEGFHISDYNTSGIYGFACEWEADAEL